MIEDKIGDDVQDEINTLKKLTLNYLTQHKNINSAKVYIKKILYDELNTRSLILVDTLLNYQMQNAKSVIENLDPGIKIAFYDLDLRSTIRELAKSENSTELLENSNIEFSKDPRQNNALFTGGSTMVVGSGITYTIWLFDPTKIPTLLAVGLATIAATIYAYKKAYEYAEPKARKLIKEDIDNYLDEVKDLILNWLLSLKKVFDDEFEQFCEHNNITYPK